ncbi:MAG: DUF3786 domain-containing protein [Dehalococcoidaceae bacterium]|nr:DUF3786 domain-containing protein [Dehalococcoidaceae bacterium]
MSTEQPKLPEQRNFEQAFQLSLKLAKNELRQIQGLEELAARAGAQIEPADTSSLLVEMLGRAYRINWPAIDSVPELPPREQLLLLHYLAQSEKLTVCDANTGQLVGYQQLPPGLVYQPVFAKRAIKPFVGRFDQKPGELLKAAAVMGGISAGYGDESVMIPALPRVKVYFILWHADEEFPARGNILYDEGILSYLPAEDVTILSELISWKLAKFM